MRQVIVPDTIRPDRKIVVMTPAGQKVAIIVPGGVQPGQAIQVQTGQPFPAI